MHTYILPSHLRWWASGVNHPGFKVGEKDQHFLANSLLYQSIQNSIKRVVHIVYFMSSAKKSY